MFDFGFSELMICGVVGLVVLGPERLPLVAKTAGQWIGKAQRFVQQMKDDIDREAELSELKKIKDDAQKMASDLNATVQNAAKDIEKDVDSVAGEAKKNLADAEKSFDAASSTPSSEAASSGIEATSADYTESASAAEYDSNDFTWIDPNTSADSSSKIFEKRYISGPSIDELASEVEQLRTKLAMSRHQFVGNNRRYAPRARSNRPRIYR